MVFGLYDCTNLPFSKTLVRDFDSFPEAVEHALTGYPVAFFAEDDDHPGQAADLITTKGLILSIEPLAGMGP